MVEILRTIASVPPPAPQGTIIRMSLLGKSCAAAAPAPPTAIASAASSVFELLMVMIGVSLGYRLGARHVRYERRIGRWQLNQGSALSRVPSISARERDRIAVHGLT